VSSTTTSGKSGRYGSFKLQVTQTVDVYVAFAGKVGGVHPDIIVCNAAEHDVVVVPGEVTDAIAELEANAGGAEALDLASWACPKRHSGVVMATHTNEGLPAAVARPRLPDWRDPRGDRCARGCLSLSMAGPCGYGSRRASLPCMEGVAPDATPTPSRPGSPGLVKTLP
jgi:hypothetical protein